MVNGNPCPVICQAPFPYSQQALILPALGSPVLLSPLAPPPLPAGCLLSALGGPVLPPPSPPPRSSYCLLSALGSPVLGILVRKGLPNIPKVVSEGEAVPGLPGRNGFVGLGTRPGLKRALP